MSRRVGLHFFPPARIGPSCATTLSEPELEESSAGKELPPPEITPPQATPPRKTPTGNAFAWGDGQPAPKIGFVPGPGLFSSKTERFLTDAGMTLGREPNFPTQPNQTPLGLAQPTVTKRMAARLEPWAREEAPQESLHST